ncbi:MAG: DUF4177 domain-containing protein [Clostridiales bacterium]|nr:DUF4177 domain-containing protein [Clostridiales bacterium]
MRLEDLYERYEYAVEKLNDTIGDDTEDLAKLLNSYAAKGWRVISIHTNEMGRNLTGMLSNTSTDETVVVFERRVYTKEEVSMLTFEKEAMKKKTVEMVEQKKQEDKEQALKAYNENLARQQEYARNVNDGLLTNNLSIINAINDMFDENPEKGYGIFDLQYTISKRLETNVDTDLLSKIMFRLSSMEAYRLEAGKFYKNDVYEE